MTLVREMVDVNDFRVPTDVGAYFRSGRPLLGTKITEGINYTSTKGLDVAQRIRSNNGHGVFYHFATASSTGRQQAAYFMAAIKKHLRNGDVVCIDIEPQPDGYRQWAHGQAATVAREFEAEIDRLRPVGVKKLIYSNQAFFDNERLPLRRGWRRWVAGYGVRPRFWPRHAVAWQFTDNAHGIPGMPAGGVDASHIRGFLLPWYHRLVPVTRYPTLRQGSTGPNVRRLQQLLNKVEHAGLTPDGNFGHLTAQALLRFKKAHRLKDDAVCRRAAWRALEKEAARA